MSRADWRLMVEPMMEATAAIARTNLALLDMREEIVREHLPLEARPEALARIEASREQVAAELERVEAQLVATRQRSFGRTLDEIDNLPSRANIVR